MVLDTNVLSVVMERQRAPQVMAWFGELAPGEVWITAITLYEARHGIARLKPGRRREGLENGLERAVHTVLAGRVLSLDEPAAREAAEIAASCRKTGRSIEFRDTFIAGIVRAHGATLATRNVRDFRDTGIPLVDPWRPDAD